LEPVFSQKDIESLVGKISSLRRAHRPNYGTDKTPMSMILPIRKWARIIDQEMPALSGPVGD